MVVKRIGENKMESDIASLIPMLEDKDNSIAYKALQKLEQISDETESVYAYIEKFVDMIGSDKYMVRVRGFRLFCKQAKWDRNHILDENIEAALHILSDAKPTAVRQALAALSDVVRYKPDLRTTVKKAVSEINYLRYKDTMHSLIEKDIWQVLDLIKEVENEVAGMIDIKDMNYEPNMAEIGELINNSLFTELCQHLEKEYKALCKIEYSKDVWLRGWNIKFKKAGKSLCTVYPKENYFTVLVVVGNKEKESVENVLPQMSDEIQEIYANTKEGNGQRWLMIDLETSGAVYNDVLKLISIRRQSK